MKKIDQLLNQVKNKKLLLVFPHPDDETVWCAGLMLRAKSMGWKVKVICLTMGERGQVHVAARGKSLSQIRQEEMEKAMRLMGVEYQMFDFGDGRLRELKGWRRELPKILERENPGLVVTYDHSGISGHPDHIAVSVELKKLVERSDSWQLLWVSAGREVKNKLLGQSKAVRYLSRPNFELKLGWKEWLMKMVALGKHKSQPLGKVKKLFLGHWREHFFLVDKRDQYDFEYVEYKI